MLPRHSQLKTSSNLSISKDVMSYVSSLRKPVTRNGRAHRDHSPGSQFLCQGIPMALWPNEGPNGLQLFTPGFRAHRETQWHPSAKPQEALTSSR